MRGQQIECIIFREQDSHIEYLLLKRTQHRGAFWQPVTGGVEGEETLMQTVIREVWEETGITEFERVISDVHSFVMTRQYLSGEKIAPLREDVFAAQVTFDTPVVLSEEEHTEYVWAPYEKALSLLKWENNKDALKKLHSLLHNS